MTPEESTHNTDRKAEFVVKPPVHILIKGKNFEVTQGDVTREIIFTDPVSRPSNELSPIYQDAILVLGYLHDKQGKRVPISELNTYLENRRFPWRDFASDKSKNTYVASRVEKAKRLLLSRFMATEIPILDTSEKGFIGITGYKVSLEYAMYEVPGLRYKRNPHLPIRVTQNP